MNDVDDDDDDVDDGEDDGWSLRAGLDRDDVPCDGECNDDTNDEITYGKINYDARAAYGDENADDGMRATTWGVGGKEDNANDEDGPKSSHRSVDVVRVKETKQQSAVEGGEE